MYNKFILVSGDKNKVPSSFLSSCRNHKEKKRKKELTELYNDWANYLTDDERETVGLYLYYGSVVDMAKAKGIDNIRSAEGQAYRRNFKKVIDKLHLLRASEEKGWKPSPRVGTSSPLSTRQYDSKK